MKKLLIGLALLAGAFTASALTVDSTVSDHCVLQQNMQNTVKGTAVANAPVSVLLGGVLVGSGQADSSGNYVVKFNPGAANATGRTLVVSDGSDTKTVSDVLVGEVWLVAGQSNAYNSMDFNEYGGAFEEWMSDINYPSIRVAISSPQSGAGFALTDSLVWQQCTTANRAKVAKISPLAFFFAKELYKGRNVPIGITLAGMGATAIGFFMTPEAIAAAKAAGKTPGWGNGEYAAYITRFDTVTARGAVWYQGETDAIIGSGSGYGKLLTALIEDWRKRRGDSNFPVIVCGFANYAGTDHSAEGKSAYDGNYEGDYKNSTIRQEQEMVAQDLNNVAVYQNVDLSGNKLKGYARAEHPDQKPESAHRAYLAALNLVYGQSDVRYRCPYPSEAFFNASKTKITVSFPSSVALTKTTEYVHFPYRVRNNGTDVNPNSVTIGADGHSLEIGWTGLTIGSGDTKVAFCNVSGTPDNAPLYEIKIVDQDGFTIPPFELKVKDSSSGGDTHAHVWGTPTYTWTAGDTICIATRKCTVSGCTQTQNMTASSVTLTVTVEPTETSEGAGYRLAVFASPYETQIKPVTIPKLNPGTGGGDDPGTGGGGSGNANGHEGVQLWAGGPYWAKCNVGAGSETDEGQFFAWGTVDGFRMGGWVPTYPFGTSLNSPANGLTLAELKNRGICDSSGVLAKAYDAASVNMGGDWRMPTKNELNDLLSNCTVVWDGDRKGLVVTGKGSYATASIFLPCPGFINQNGRANDKFSTNYLSSTPSGTEKAWSIFESSYGASAQEAARLTGFPVRGVITDLGSGSGTGGGDTPGHTHSWSAAAYSWSANFATCTASRVCPGCGQQESETVNTTYSDNAAAGLRTYTATFTKSGFATQTKVVSISGGGGDDPGTGGGGSGNANGHEGVQLWAGGPYWAKCNVGAGSETDEGQFFAWGTVDGFRMGGWVPTYPFGTSLNSPANGLTLAELKNRGICDSSGVLAKAYDAASVNMGGDWRMPTKAELSDLLSNCTVVWDSDREGFVITGKGSYASASIFLPCPGYVNQNGRANNKFTTNYLSSTPSGTEKAWSIFECSQGPSVSEAVRLTGFPVRGVITDIGSGSGTGGGDDPGTGGGDNPGTGGGDNPGTGGGDTPVNPTPAFGSADWYVSPSGSDSGNGSSAAPFQTIARAVEAASAGQRICVKKGTYNVKAADTMYADGAAITVEKAVTIFGETGNPADVVVHNTKNWDGSANYNYCYRVFKLNHAGAVLSGLTVENGIARGSRTDPKFYGCNVKIDANGGTVTNCIIRNGHCDSIHTAGADPSTNGGAAIACFSQDGLITHCVVSNNFASMGRTSPNQTTQTGGTAVLIKAGTLRQTFVVYNTLSECWTASAVHVEEDADVTTLVENCTVACNRYVDGGTYGAYSDSGELYPIWVPLNSFDGKSRMPEIRNCLIYGNVTHGGGKSLIDWSKYNDSQYKNAKAAAAAAFVNCATDMTPPNGMSATPVSASDMDGINPKAGTALANQNVGCTWRGASGSGTGTGGGDDPGTGGGTVDPVTPVNPGGTQDGHEGVQLWANGPYWATMNCGATKVGLAGSYYAGPGDTKGKSVKDGALTGSLVDNTSVTLWGGNWRKPRESDFQGLVDNTVYLGVETVDGQPNVKLGGKADPYKNSFILIPVAGWGNGGNVSAAPNCWGTQGRYWGSTQSGSFMRDLSIILGSSSMKMELVSNHAQDSNIYSVRMCCDEVSSSTHEHAYTAAPTYKWTKSGSGYTCTASIPCNHQGCTVAKTQTVTASCQVLVAPTETADGLGRYTAVFTDAAFATQTQDAVIPRSPAGGDPNGYEYVQLWADGPFWAKANVGAGSETDEGLFFSYGWVSGFSVGGYHVTYPFGSTTESPAVGMTLAELKSAGICDSSGVLARAYDAASVNMGGDWRMPTKADFDSLLSNCDCVWDDSRKGLVATGRGDFDDVSIFLPCPGYVNQNGRANDKFQTYYLSATPVGTDNFYGLYMASNGKSVSTAARANGFPVRGVIDSVQGYVPHTHAWSAPTYAWTQTTDGYECTATVSCGGCNRTRSETVAASGWVTAAPTCTTGGSATYTAVFSSYGTASKTVVLPPAHDWATPTYAWTPGYSNCTGTAVCKLDGSHTVTEKAKMTFVVTQKPSITKTGVGHFVATFAKEPFAEQTSPDVAIPVKDAGDLPSASYYVALSGSDANGGTTPQAAFASIAKAVAAAPAGSTVCILDGTFEISEEIVIDKAITVVGLGYQDTIIRPAAGKKIRLVTLDGGAKLEGVTLTGGNYTKGAGALVLDGTLSWCCISNNQMTAHSSEGSGVSFSGGKGTVDHCVIACNKTTGQGSYGAGIGGGGTSPVGEILVDSCLIYGNKITGNGAGGGIGIKNMNHTLTVRNCTITGNTGTMYSGGICREGGSGKTVLINTILCGNAYGSTHANLKCNALDADNSSNCFVGLASEASVTIGGVTKTVPGFVCAEPQFVDAGADNYRLAAGSPGIGAGVAYGGIDRDLDGELFADPPSVGCYEFLVEEEPPHEHTWSDPTYAWVPTAGGYACAATVTCSCGETMVENGAVASSVTTPATCTTDGTLTYMATFETLGTAVKTVAIPSGHDWGEVVYEWDLTEGACSAVATCRRDGSHVQTVEATVTLVITELPKIGKPGKGHYVATFADAGLVTQTSEELVVSVRLDGAEPAVEGGKGSWDAGTGTLLVTPEEGVKSVSVVNLPGDGTAAVPPTVSEVTGVTKDQVKVIAGMATGTGVTTVNITGAFKVTDTGAGGVTLELDQKGSVTVGDEVITTEPELTDSDDAVKPFVAGDEVAVGVRTIPGLKYDLLRGGTPTGIDKDAPVATAVASGTRTELADPMTGGKPAQAFYVIRADTP